MADEQTPNATPPATPAAPVPQPTVPTITPEVQALIDAARSDERTKTQNATWAEARRKYDKQPDPPKPQPSEQSAAPSPALSPESVKQMIANESAIARGVALHGYSATQEASLRTLIEASKPPDVAAFIAEMTTVFNITKPNSTVTQPHAPAVVSNAPPRAAAPAPSVAVPGDGPERVLTWSEQQIADFSGKNGGNASNPMHWSNRQAAIKIAQLVEAEMAGMHFTARKR